MYLEARKKASRYIISSAKLEIDNYLDLCAQRAASFRIANQSSPTLRKTNRWSCYLPTIFVRHQSTVTKWNSTYHTIHSIQHHPPNSLNPKQINIPLYTFPSPNNLKHLFPSSPKSIPR